MMVNKELLLTANGMTKKTRGAENCTERVKLAADIVCNNGVGLVD
jgi:hypothetical protein